jgi:hypothetical protein
MPAKKRKIVKKVKDIEQMEVSDGKIWDSPPRGVPVKNPKTLADILGRTTPRYSVASIEDYRKMISEMNLIDVQHECVRIGMRPISDRDKMVFHLLQQFEIYAGTQSAKAVAPRTLKPTKEIMDILSKGANSLA